jgi:hypothetical protein
MTGVPALLVEAAELVLADLRDGDGPEVRLDFQPAPDDARSWRVSAVFADMVVGFEVAVAPQLCSALTVAVADGLQQAFIEHLWQARPLCPLHAHPLSAEDAEGQARWICPTSGAWSCPIGAYHETTDRGGRA